MTHQSKNPNKKKGKIATGKDQKNKNKAEEEYTRLKYSQGRPFRRHNSREKSPT